MHTSQQQHPTGELRDYLNSVITPDPLAWWDQPLQVKLMVTASYPSSTAEPQVPHYRVHQPSFYPSKHFRGTESWYTFRKTIFTY